MDPTRQEPPAGRVQFYLPSEVAMRRH